MSNSTLIFIRVSDTPPFEFDIPQSSTTAQFRARVAERLRVSPNHLRLLYSGNVLRDEVNLSQYDILPNTVVQAVVQPELPDPGTPASPQLDTTTEAPAAGLIPNISFSFPSGAPQGFNPFPQEVLGIIQRTLATALNPTGGMPAGGMQAGGTFQQIQPGIATATFQESQPSTGGNPPAPEAAPPLPGQFPSLPLPRGANIRITQTGNAAFPLPGVHPFHMGGARPAVRPPEPLINGVQLHLHVSPDDLAPANVDSLVQRISAIRAASFQGQGGPAVFPSHPPVDANNMGNMGAFGTFGAGAMPPQNFAGRFTVNLPVGDAQNLSSQPPPPHQAPNANTNATWAEPQEQPVPSLAATLPSVIPSPDELEGALRSRGLNRESIPVFSQFLDGMRSLGSGATLADIQRHFVTSSRERRGSQAGTESEVSYDSSELLTVTTQHSAVVPGLDFDAADEDRGLGELPDDLNDLASELEHMNDSPTSVRVESRSPATSPFVPPSSNAPRRRHRRVIPIVYLFDATQRGMSIAQVPQILSSPGSFFAVNRQVLRKSLLNLVRGVQKVRVKNSPEAESEAPTTTLEDANYVDIERVTIIVTRGFLFQCGFKKALESLVLNRDVTVQPARVGTVLAIRLVREIIDALVASSLSQEDFTHRVSKSIIQFVGRSCSALGPIVEGGRQSVMDALASHNWEHIGSARGGPQESELERKLSEMFMKNMVRTISSQYVAGNEEEAVQWLYVDAGLDAPSEMRELLDEVLKPRKRDCEATGAGADAAGPAEGTPEEDETDDEDEDDMLSDAFHDAFQEIDAARGADSQQYPKGEASMTAPTPSAAPAPAPAARSQTVASDVSSASISDPIVVRDPSLCLPLPSTLVFVPRLVCTSQSELLGAPLDRTPLLVPAGLVPGYQRKDPESQDKCDMLD